ncbi:MAG: hypothetical protein ACAH83_18715 [Alphaproteobacteria bacterium]
MEKTTNNAQTRALVDPMADFWLVGGAGVVMFAIMAGMTEFWTGQGLHDKASWLENQSHWWAAYAAFAINFPHFAYSYLLFYPGYKERLTSTETTLMSKIRLAVAGLAVPAIMICFFVYAWHAQDQKYLSWGVMAMIFSVGWHYVKQGYGVLITLSLYKKVFYNNWEKRILYVNGYAVWIYTWCRTNSVTGVQPYYDITYQVTAYPSWLVLGSLYLSWITTALAAGVLIKHWLYDTKGLSFGKWGGLADWKNILRHWKGVLKDYREIRLNWDGISLNALMGYVAAIYLWVMAPYMNMAFYVFIPLFHSLQYLPFVYKYKKSEFIRARHAPEGDPRKTQRRALLWLCTFVVTGIALGALFFDIIPNYLDAHPLLLTSNPANVVELDQQFFIIAFIVFINVHHFFIDSAFWRRDNREVQQYLFRA